MSKMHMLFSEKEKLEKEYLQWCEKANKEIHGGRIDDKSFITVIRFLQSIGWDNIKELESENAELRARLDKAVELPCKIGDKVYAIVPIEDELKILDGTFVGIEEVVSDFKGCMCAIIVRKAKDGHYFNTYWDLGHFNKTWWADKEIAESKLAEVMGNHGM